MLSWLSRMLGREEAAVASKAPTSAAPSATATVTPELVEPPNPGLGARRPLLDDSGRIAGFEFGLSEAQESRVRERRDAVVEAAHVRLLLGAMRPTLESGRAALLRTSRAVLLRPGVADDALPKTLVAIEDALLPENDGLIEVIDGMRKRGVQIGVPSPVFIGNSSNDTVLPDWADFVLLRYDAGGISRLLPAAVRCRQQRPDRRLIATDIDDVNDLELVLRSGFTLAAGALRQTRLPAEAQPLPLAVQRLAKLLNGLLQDMDTALIARELRADVGLSYRLLRYVNSASMGLRRQIESIEQAVVILGRAELYRWLSVLLTTAGEARPTSLALQEVALARARLLENLAKASKIDPPPALFTVGLLSVLDALLQRPLAEIVAPLNLPAQAVAALLNGQGPWYVYLDVARRLELQQAVPAEALAPFGGLARVLAFSDEAWEWAGRIVRQAT